MKRIYAAFVPACVSAGFNTVVIAETRQEEADAANVNPEQEAAIRIGTMRRWQTNIDEAKRVYERICTMAPQSSDGQFPLAATDALDHDDVRAEQFDEQDAQKWPHDTGVQQAAHDFRRQRNALLHLFWVSDLSFATRQAEAVGPIAARDGVGVEYRDATSYAPQLDDAEIYTRPDQRVIYAHHFERNSMLDISVRNSKYSYNVPDSALEYSRTAPYHDYRICYRLPVMQAQVIAVRYTTRPTTLRLSQNDFTAHKLEAALNSRWTPRFFTMLGGGWRRDLDSNAISNSQLTDRSLFRVGFQWDTANRLSIGAKYITNPDLDYSMNALAIAESSRSLTKSWSALARYCDDEYKAGTSQTGCDVATRFVPNSHRWSEFRLKQSRRDTANETYGLVPVTYRF